MKSTSFTFPDLHRISVLKDAGVSTAWPCTAPPNPLGESAEVETLQWIKSFRVLSERKFGKFSNQKKFNLVSWGGRRLGKDHFQLYSDMINFLWVIDDQLEEKSSTEVQGEVMKLKRILEDPDMNSTEQGVFEVMSRI